MTRMFIAALLGVTLTACGGGPGDLQTGPGVRVGEGIPGLKLSLEMDPTMLEEDQIRLQEDFQVLLRLQIDGSRSRYFSQVFGGNSASNVLSYIDDRMNYVIPYGVDVDKRIDVSKILPNALAIPGLNVEGDGDDPRVVATNVGMVLWLIRESLRPQSMHFFFGGKRIPVESSRIGIVQLGRGYSGRLTRMERIGTHVHESRHSDCTGGLPRSDVMRIQNDLMPQGNTCGHLHSQCPPGHSLAGLYACDEHAWGAYAVQSVFFATVGESCYNCTELDRQVAFAAGADAASRILPLPAMLDGRLGPPDMGSSGVRR